MKVIYITNSGKVEFGTVAMYDKPAHSKYGVLHNIVNKLELVTTEHVTDYFMFSTENGKKFFVINSNSQIGSALKLLAQQLSETDSYQFKPLRYKIYFRVSDELAKSIPKNRRLLVSVNVYGVFEQTSSGLSFLQIELSGFKVYALVDFEVANDHGMIV